MTGVYDLVKDRKTYSVTVDQSVLEAARLMSEHNIGALAVLRDGELAGILSERDIVKRVVALGRSPGTTTTGEVMTAKPRVVSPDESVEECLYVMREFGFRHLPICEGTQLKGLVSIRDIFFRPGAQRSALAS
jgi:CBS domain-containing protein